MGHSPASQDRLVPRLAPSSKAGCHVLPCFLMCHSHRPHDHVPQVVEAVRAHERASGHPILIHCDAAQVTASRASDMVQADTLVMCVYARGGVGMGVTVPVAPANP